MTYLFANDGASSITLLLDDRQFVVGAGETIQSVSGETLSSLELTVAAVAWRFLGA